MDTLFQKFSLQNLLRQFFCGVVFFIPPYLFAPGYLGEWSQVTSLESGAFLLFSAVALCLGTIIYHLEKNLYSYSVQTVFELLPDWAVAPLFCMPVAVALVLAIIWSSLCCVSCLACICCVFGGVIGLVFVMGIIALLFSPASRRVIARTQECWFLEEKMLKNDSTDSHIRMCAIAKRVSSWSDFIHCTQSCCFAWLLGCALCRYVLYHDVYCYPCLIAAWDAESPLLFSVHVALVVLLLELMFDWHRYQHVIKMTKMSGLRFSNLLPE